MRGARATTADSITDSERRAQNLPIPVGGLAPAHRTQHRLRVWWRRSRVHWVSVLAVALAIAGIAFAVWTPEPAVYEQAGVVHLGNVVLHAAPGAQPNQKLFTGDAALAITGSADRMKAAAVTSINGVPTTGWCNLRTTADGDASEGCVFHRGTQNLSASDTFNRLDGRWERIYSDGHRVTFRVPSGTTAIPIPLPLGD